MRRWITAIFPWIAVVALLLIVARFMLSVLGLAGADGENIKLLAKLMPASITLLLGSVAIIIFELRRQSRIIDVRSKRLVDEAEEWNDQDQFGELSPERALGWQSLSDAESSPNENGVFAYSAQETSANTLAETETVKIIDTLANNEPHAGEVPPPFTHELLPEIERRIEEIFGKRLEPTPEPEVAYNQQGMKTGRADEDVVVAYLEPLQPAGADDYPVVMNSFVEYGETGYRRVTADIMPDTNQLYDVTYDLEPEAESEDELLERSGKKISEEVIARYQQLIESAQNPV